MPIAVSDHGIWKQVWQAARWLADSGASDAAKSTARDETAWSSSLMLPGCYVLAAGRR
jgi:hypothetical protein